MVIHSSLLSLAYLPRLREGELFTYGGTKHTIIIFYFDLKPFKNAVCCKGTACRLTSMQNSWGVFEGAIGFGGVGGGKSVQKDGFQGVCFILHSSYEK
jgi:hypothetical protein